VSREGMRPAYLGASGSVTDSSRGGQETHELRQSSTRQTMRSALLVQENQERLFGPRSRVIDGGLASRWNELDGRETRDAILGCKRFRGCLIGVQVGDLAAVVAVKRRGDLRPRGLETLAVSTLRRARFQGEVEMEEERRWTDPGSEEGDESSLGLTRDNMVEVARGQDRL
jgi:hypothetical protein